MRSVPRETRLLAFDACGALLSAVLLGFVFPAYAVEFGASPAALRALATVAIGLALFDGTCLLLGPHRPRFVLYVIALANIAYPLVTAAVLARDREPLRALGLGYVIVETMIVAGLGAIELRAARNPRTPLQKT